MSGDQWVGLVWIAGGVVLVGSGLIARRLPMRQSFATALAWAGIFALAYAIARLIS